MTQVLCSSFCCALCFRSLGSTRRTTSGWGLRRLRWLRWLRWNSSFARHPGVVWQLQISLTMDLASTRFHKLSPQKGLTAGTCSLYSLVTERTNSKQWLQFAETRLVGKSELSVLVPQISYRTKEAHRATHTRTLHEITWACHRSLSLSFSSLLFPSLLCSSLIVPSCPVLVVSPYLSLSHRLWARSRVLFDLLADTTHALPAYWSFASRCY